MRPRSPPAFCSRCPRPRTKICENRTRFSRFDMHGLRCARPKSSTQPRVSKIREMHVSARLLCRARRERGFTRGDERTVDGGREQEQLIRDASAPPRQGCLDGANNGGTVRDGQTTPSNQPFPEPLAVPLLPGLSSSLLSTSSSRCSLAWLFL